MSRRTVVGLVGLLCVASIESLTAQIIITKSYPLDPRYSKDDPIKVPATLTLMRGDGGWKTQLDAAVLYRNYLRPGWLWDVGVAFAVGSNRKEAARTIVPVASIKGAVGGLAIQTSASYEATTNGDSRDLTLALLFGPRIWRSGGIDYQVGSGPLRFNWRPYLGLETGHVFASLDSLEGRPGQEFVRPRLSIETRLRLHKGSKPDSPLLAELNVNADAWYIARPDSLFGRFSPSLTFFPAGTRSIGIKLDYLVDRKPPSYAKEETVTLGLGIRL